MIRRLLCWTLALTTLNAPVLAVGDEPVDPYSWLEDVAGAKALTWVKECQTPKDSRGRRGGHRPKSAFSSRNELDSLGQVYVCRLGVRST